ncbi:hypothetical protein R1flu_002962 [Riccia fluitans]|uniref:Cytochrome P450 n=1 Tax=Riccia fluitans TaxID=41844 RepID=A0ABD1YB24_9MARC
MKEIFRLHSVGPLMIPHVSPEESVIQGYNLPKRSRLIVNVYALYRDPKVYDRASEFLPERFLGSQKDVHDYDLMPFCTGLRMFPGKGLGHVLVQYAVALFVQTCSLSLPPGLKPKELDMEEKFGITFPRLNPLQAVAVPRLPDRVLCALQN